MAAAVQETSARLGLLTGKGLATLIRERFSRPVLYIAVLLTLVANTFNIGADVGSMAAAMRLLVDVPAFLFVVVLTAVMLVLEITVPYYRYARVLRWLALSLLAYVLVLFTVHVDWPAVLAGLTNFRFGGQAAELGALIAVFGTTVSPYLFFWQCSEEVEETASNGASVATDDALRAMRVDVIGGMISAVAIAFVIMVVAATTVHKAGITQIATADQAAAALRPLAGDFAELIFSVGIVGLGLLAVPVLAGSSAYALAEAFDWHEGLSRTFREAKGFYLVIAASMLGGVLVGFLGLDPIRILYYAAILNGVTAPPLIALMLVLARDPTILDRHTSGRLSTTILAGTVLISVALPILYLLSP
jgi:Mn2+/Fe2+ NRAMP family transporter